MKAVLFDLDGVITDTAEYHYQAWKRLGDEIGVDITPQFNEQLKGLSRSDSLDCILKYGGKMQTYSKKEKHALAEQKNDVYLQMIQKITPADLLPGIGELLEKLKARNYKIALCSASKNGPAILKLLTIDNLFDAIVDPASLKAGKPAPDIFLKGAKLVSVEPNQCVGIEDANAGITAIKTAGMVAVGIGDAMQLRDADRILSSTSELSIEMLESVWQLNKH